MLALGSSFTNTGTFGIHDNTTLTVAGGFSNSATLDVDSNDNASYGTGEGGSGLTVTGTLANTGAVQIGDPILALDAATTVTLGGLTNAGRSDSFILDGSSKYAATLDFTNPAGFTSNGGTFELTYGGLLALGSSFTNTGTFGIHDNTTLTVAGGFSNSATLDIDNNDNPFQGTAEGGSSLTVTGTLANTGVVQLGDAMLLLDAATNVHAGRAREQGAQRQLHPGRFFEIQRHAGLHQPHRVHQQRRHLRADLWRVAGAGQQLHQQRHDRHRGQLLRAHDRPDDFHDDGVERHCDRGQFVGHHRSDQRLEQSRLDHAGERRRPCPLRVAVGGEPRLDHELWRGDRYRRNLR